MNQATAIKPPKPVKPIPFSDPATNFNVGLNSLGETGHKAEDHIAVTNFPYKLSRCDQVVHVPVTYINNEDDYRVRHTGYVTITAHLTNLFHAKDGQKLIQSTNHSTMKSDPCHLLGARGCIKLSKDVHLRLHNMEYCLENEIQAENILYIYKEFKRCRLGDNLQPIPPQLLNALQDMCKKTKKKVGMLIL